MKTEYEVIIVGGGPAGLSAALVLGRARRKILVLDNRRHRNAASNELHGYLTRDGIRPLEFLQAAREELSKYDIDHEEVTVMNAAREDSHFRITIEDGSTITSRMLLLATGVQDRIPKIEGILELYGKSVHHCPYCDGWEWRDKRIGVLARGKAGLALTMKLRNWSSDLVLCTHGPARYPFEEQSALESKGITLIKTRIERLEGENGMLRRIHFRDGSSIERDTLFFSSGQDQSCNLAESLGCTMTKKGVAKTDSKQLTNIPGLYVAGDASRDMHFVVVAAAEGAKAAVAINEAFTKEESKDVVDL